MENEFISALKMDVFWVVALCSLVEVYQRVRSPCCLNHQGRTSETLVNFYQTTRRYNTEDSHLHTRRENLISHFYTDRAGSETARVQKTLDSSTDSPDEDFLYFPQYLQANSMLIH
jgi:hypothetical protein